MTTANPPTVLVAVDSSEQARNAFDFYVKSLHQAGDHVLLLHCPELSNVTLRLMQGQDAPYDNWLEIWADEEAKWKNIQNMFENRLSRAGIPGTFEVEGTDKPGETIVKIAEERNVKYVVMGTRGYGPIRRTVMGSVSDYVVHHCRAPVFVYRPNKPERKLSLVQPMVPVPE